MGGQQLDSRRPGGQTALLQAGHRLADKEIGREHQRIAEDDGAEETGQEELKKAKSRTPVDHLGHLKGRRVVPEPPGIEGGGNGGGLGAVLPVNKKQKVLGLSG